VRERREAGCRSKMSLEKVGYHRNTRTSEGFLEGK
jgi:hypothetical protein